LVTGANNNPAKQTLFPQIEAPLESNADKPGILVVDDELPIQMMLAFALRHKGFTVWLASSGQEALELYQQHQEGIDLVLLDVQMPDMDG
jgi:two-component system cell cycle sensor histidine kinase/response regulator CckA